MSFLKKALGTIGSFVGIGKQAAFNNAINNPPHWSLANSDIPWGNYGGYGGPDNPIEIEGVSIAPPKGNTKNWLDKAISGIDSISGLIGNIKGNANESSVVGKVSDDLNDFLKNSTKDVEVKAGINDDTKKLLFLGGGLAVILVLLNRKKR